MIYYKKLNIKAQNAQYEVIENIPNIFGTSNIECKLSY